jgi:excisionase family DNA binding protein
MKMLTTMDAAVRLGLTVQRVHQLIKDGSLHAEKLGRDYVINGADLESVTHRRPVGRPPKTSAISVTGKPKTVRTESGVQATGKSDRRKSSKS